MSDKYVFLDRDGVINKDGAGVTEYGYVTRWEDFQFIPGVLEAMSNFNRNGFKCVVISNQQCVSKDICSEDDVMNMTDRMMSEIRKHGGDIAGVFYCFHHKSENCLCRKPRSGLFEKAQKELNIGDLKGLCFVGDTERDIQAGKEAGLKTILVLSGKTGREEAEGFTCKPDFICKDLLEAVDVVMKETM